MPIYITAAVIFILLKIWFSAASVESLNFLLKPTDLIFGLVTGSKSVFIEDYGYFHQRMNILIDKSCCGFNYWIMCFLIFTFLFTKHLSRLSHKIIALPVSLFFAWILTIFVNSSRIYISFTAHNQTMHFIPNHQQLIHQIIGIAAYLSFLLITYLLLEKILKNRKVYEKFN